MGFREALHPRGYHGRFKRAGASAKARVNSSPRASRAAARASAGAQRAASSKVSRSASARAKKKGQALQAASGSSHIARGSIVGGAGFVGGQAAVFAYAKARGLKSSAGGLTGAFILGAGTAGYQAHKHTRKKR